MYNLFTEPTVRSVKSRCQHHELSCVIFPLQGCNETIGDILFEKDGYVLVTWNKILHLIHRHCLTPGCSAIVDPEETRLTEQGAAVTIHLTCLNNHINSWNTSEFYPKQENRV